MKKIKIISWIFVGVCIGVVWACGSSTVSDIGTAVAEALGTALEVTYDNSSSGLSATTVQGAIDEIYNNIDEDVVSESTALVGTWSGTRFFVLDTLDIDITFNADGTWSCTTFFQENSDKCAAALTWQALTRGVILKHNYGGEETGEIFEVLYKSSNKLVLLQGSAHYELTRQ
ncbi:MAG: hypothetical protein HQM16_19550 [Deltaproteobacteria bacterium]|nr:hypothetical protein [Deltaproteobacteria bacterium]